MEQPAFTRTAALPSGVASGSRDRVSCRDHNQVAGGTEVEESCVL
ncbi:MAG: hypothetical protein Q7U96_05555 [Chloroflexota bacterium]|nr:hypothetical protein [Chloroflexota bacterium]